MTSEGLVEWIICNLIRSCPLLLAILELSHLYIYILYLGEKEKRDYRPKRIVDLVD